MTADQERTAIVAYARACARLARQAFDDRMDTVAVSFEAFADGVTDGVHHTHNLPETDE